MNLCVRRWCLLALVSAPVVLGLGAQSLVVRLDNDYLRVNAPNLQFLSGKPLERLHNGSTVGFLGQLSVAVGAQNNVQVRSVARFAFSYDIWEERFKVTLLTPGLTARSSAKNLTAQAAQAWCLDNLKIDLAQVPLDRPIWVRLEIRAEDPRDTENVIGEPGISLSRLLELLSRPPKSPQSHWVLETGPLTVSDLRKHTSLHNPSTLFAQTRTTPHNAPALPAQTSTTLHNLGHAATAAFLALPTTPRDGSTLLAQTRTTLHNPTPIPSRAREQAVTQVLSPPEAAAE